MKSNNKSILRKYLLQQRISNFNNKILDVSNNIDNKLYNNFMSLLDKVIKLYFSNETNIDIALFYPTKYEIDVTKLIVLLLNNKYSICLPKMSESTFILDFLQYTQETNLIENAYGIKEPPITSKVTLPKIVVVPTLGFDNSGYRIGYGKGYYDQTLYFLKQKKFDIITIGIAYEFQKVETVFPEKHDMKLDYIVTEDNIYKFDFLKHEHK